MTKSERLEVLRVILAGRAMGSHEEIMAEMERNGCPVTQATLSRDLRTLNAAKVTDKDGYRYVLPESPNYRHKVEPELVPEYLRNTGFLSIVFSGNIAVIRTRAGYAAGLATDIDARKLPSIAGTVAGTDTILAVLAEGATRQECVDDLATVVPAVKSVML